MRIKILILACLLTTGLLAAAPHAGAGTINIPAGSALNVVQREDPSFIEHIPLGNLVNWTLFIRTGVCDTGNTNTCLGGAGHGGPCTMDIDCPSAPLTFTGGTGQFYDENGQPILGLQPISPALFMSSASAQGGAAIVIDGNGNAVIPANSNIALPFPFETLGHNVVPGSADMSLCFAEFDGPGPGCDDPLQVLGVQLIEYRASIAYIFPLGNPQIDPGADLFLHGSAGHQIGDNHNFSRSQRYAYDVEVQWNGAQFQGTGAANSDWFIYGDPLYTMADGTVVVADAGPYAENVPKSLQPGVNMCPTQLCAGGVAACQPGQIPTHGQRVVVQHANGEFTSFAHIQPGTMAVSCGQAVTQGTLVGQVGNVGNSSQPHLHFEAGLGVNGLARPTYYNNVQFGVGGNALRRQLDVALVSLMTWDIIAPPTPLASNAALPSGAVAEVEPNDTLSQHDALTYPTTVSAQIETADTGDLAVRGDGIEDVFRVNLPAADALRFDLAGGSPPNMDLYVLTEDLRVLNETRQGTSPGSVERVCLELDAGAYYVMVTGVDPTKSATVPYELEVDSDPQTISCAVTSPVSPIPVDGGCEATVPFKLSIHDNCCLDPDSLALQISVANPGGNATLGPLEIDAPVVLGPTDIEVTGRVPVSALTSCPAEIVVQAQASDCSGRVVTTTALGTGCHASVVDDTAPTLVTALAADPIWSPPHELTSVGYEVTASDNCDTTIGASLAVRVWSDEPEVFPGAGQHAPDAADFLADLRLRGERSGTGDGRVYLVAASAVDACGNSAFACDSAGVPRDQGDKALAALAAQRQAAEAFCGANGGAPPPGYIEQGLAQPAGPKQ